MHTGIKYESADVAARSGVKGSTLVRYPLQAVDRTGSNVLRERMRREEWGNGDPPDLMLWGEDYKKRG